MSSATSHSNGNNNNSSSDNEAAGSNANEEQARLFEELRTKLMLFRPDSIEDLIFFEHDEDYTEKLTKWASSFRNEDDISDHLFAEMLDLWCTEDEIQELLSNEERLTSLVESLLMADFLSFRDMRGYAVRDDWSIKISVSPCDGCNQYMDQRKNRCKQLCTGRSYKVLKGATKESQTQLHGLHQLTIILPILSQLLAHSESEKFLSILFDLCSDPWKVLSSKFTRPDNAPNTMHFFPRLSIMCTQYAFAGYPKLSRFAIGFFSILLCRRPARVLHIFQGETEAVHLIDAYEMPLKLIEVQLNNSKSTISLYDALAYIVNALPGLYHLASFKAVIRNPDFEKIVQRLYQIGSYFAALAIDCDPFNEHTNGEENALQESAQIREFSCAAKYLEPLLLRDGEASDCRLWRKKLLAERPDTFVAAACFELYGWWSRQGVDIIRCSGLNIHSFGYLTSIILGGLQSRSHFEQIQYVYPIMEALMERQCPPIPDAEKSLLFGPLMDANRRCGLDSCRSPRSKDGGDLLRCNGHCNGMEHYCCKEHQVEDWHTHHKKFCKKNKL